MSLSKVLLEERQVAYLDPYAERLLSWINVEGVYRSTSSCTGRIALVEGEWPWERRGDSRIVFKSHYPVTPERLALELSKPFDPLWLKVTGPIIHVRARSMECASMLLEAAWSEGFKHSGIISLSAGDDWCCVVEISAPTQFSSPLRLYGTVMVAGRQLDLLARKANRALAEGRRRFALLAWRVNRMLSGPCRETLGGDGGGTL